MANLSNTQYFKVKTEPEVQVKEVLDVVYTAMEEKGYNPVNQIVGYIMSGDPTYITSYKGARSMIMKVERDELVEELLKEYIKNSNLGEPLMRVLGLDYGSKTVGVAVSDPLGLTAQGVEIIRRKSENKMRQTLARIEELIREYQVEKIVLGLPKNMNNTLGDRAEKSLELKKTLERRTGLAVVMWDERLTTVSANRVLMETGVRREKRKDYVDEIAAIFILQNYLDYMYHTEKQNPAEEKEQE